MKMLLSFLFAWGLFLLLRSLSRRGRMELQPPTPKGGCPWNNPLEVLAGNSHPLIFCDELLGVHAVPPKRQPEQTSKQKTMAWHDINLSFVGLTVFYSRSILFPAAWIFPLLMASQFFLLVKQNDDVTVEDLQSCHW